MLENNWFYDYNSYKEYTTSELLIKEKNDKTTKSFFNIAPDKYHIDFLIENKITNCIFTRDCVLINNKLSDYDFYKVLDPYSAFQELEMWMQGVLSYPQNIMIEVEDKSKIEKHGFDKKYGFRTRPKK